MTKLVQSSNHLDVPQPLRQIASLCLETGNADLQAASRRWGQPGSRSGEPSLEKGEQSLATARALLQQAYQGDIRQLVVGSLVFDVLSPINLGLA